MPGMKRGVESSAEELRERSEGLSDDMQKAEELHQKIKKAKRVVALQKLTTPDEWFYMLMLAAVIEVKLASWGLKPGQDDYNACLKRAKRAYKNLRDAQSKNRQTYKESVNMLKEAAKSIERDYEFEVEDNKDKISKRLNKAKQNDSSLFGELYGELKKRFREDEKLKAELKKKVQNNKLVTDAISDACDSQDSWLWWLTKKFAKLFIIDIVQVAIIALI